MSILYSIVIIICLIFMIRFLSSKKGMINLFFIFTILFLVISVIIYPKNSVDTALKAVNTWLFVIIPSMFPFFIGAELLIHSGFIDFISVLLEPIMYPLFRVPGNGSFVFAMSVTSGYPIGASLVSDLRIKKSLSKDEAQRLAAFSSTSGPLFIIGAVAIGMLKNPATGLILSLAHYASAITIGLVFRFYGSDRNNITIKSKSNNLKQFYNAFINLKNINPRPITVLMKKAIESSFSSMFMIGGFIIIYSVIIEILNVTNIIPQISHILSLVIPFKLNTDSINFFLSGLLELTNGCNNIATLSIPLIWKLCMTSFLIAWGGLSVHSQAISFMGKTDINISIYLLSKLAHGLLATLYTFVLYIFFFQDNINSVTVNNSQQISTLANAISILKHSIYLELTVVSLFFISSLFLSIYLFIKQYFKKLP